MAALIAGADDAFDLGLDLTEPDGYDEMLGELSATCPALGDALEGDPVEEVVATIERTRPSVVFAPHVETASGILLPDDYLRAVADATHAAGGIFVLDCIASGPLWVDMEALDADVLVSAPQKGWSGTPATGYVLLRERGRAAVEAGTSTSFALDLRAWLDVSDAYVTGATPYRATLPTDAIARNAELARETVERGLEPLRKAQEDLRGGNRPGEHDAHANISSKSCSYRPLMMRIHPARSTRSST